MTEYGLVSYPLGHSFSQKFFTEKFHKEHIDAQYLKFEIPVIDLLPHIILDHNNLAGLNVTIPYKEQLIPFLSQIDLLAQEIGAVNVIKIYREGNNARLKGFNTDVIGFKNSIASLLIPSVHTKALILGTGGASKAVFYGLKELGVEPVYVSRSPGESRITYADLDEKIMDEYKVIVNASPVGTFPDVDACPAIPYELLTADHLLYDLVYNPAETKFLRLGKARRATIKNGAEMLELQALAAWDIWNDETK